MQFSVLGPLEIRRDGQRIDVSSPKQRALLILLLLDVGRTVSVDRLIDDLWAGDPPPRALITLRSYVSNLRRALEGEQRTGGVLLTRGRGYALEVDPGRIDAIRFERLLADARRELEAGRPEDTLADVDAALALWRGAPLDDVAFENFAQGPIARLEELRLTAHEDRFEALLRLGRDGAVVAELQAFTAANPLRERPRSQLMLALYRAGRAGEAMSIYTAFRAALADELGLDPSPALADLAERILRQSPDLDLPERGAVGAPAAHVTATAQAPPDEAGPPLVGREVEQKRIEAALDRLSRGHSGLLLLAGEPGIGKTALLRWLDATARIRGVPAHWGRCQPTAGAPPFWPWIQIIRSIAAGLSDGELREAASGVAAPIARIVDEVAMRVGHGRSIGAEEPLEARFVIYEAMLAFLRRTTPRQGAVLILDDVHWAGPPSLELLTLLAGQLAEHTVLAAVAYRDLPAERSPGLDAALAALAREDVQQLPLTGLSEDHTAVVVADVTRVSPSDDLVAAVHERTDGNPFFVHQLARLLDDSSGARHDGRVSTAIPVGARHVISRRLQLVPEATRQMLDAASVAGRDFDLRVASAAAGMTLDQGVDAGDAAVAHGLAEHVGDAALSYRFVHTLIRDAIYDMLTPARAARLHRQVGLALERQADPPTAALAEHFWRAADVTEDDRPLRYMLDAAEHALAVHAYEFAEEYVRRALHLLAHRAGDDATAEVAVRHRLLHVISSVQGWSAEAIGEVAQGTLDLVAVPEMTRDLLPAWWSLWGNAVTRAEHGVARDLADQLSEAASAHPEPATQAAADLFVAYSAFFAREEPEDQLRRLARARAYVDEADEGLLAAIPEHLGVLLGSADAMLRALSGATGARGTATETVRFAASLGRPFSEVYARFFAGAVGALKDDAAYARDAAAPALEICRRLGLRYGESLATVSHAWAQARTGTDPGAEAKRLDEAIDTLRRAGQRHGLPMWLALLAEAHALAGDDAAAARSLDEAEAVADEIGERVYGRLFARVRSRSVARSG